MQLRDRLYDGLEKMLSYRLSAGYSAGTEYRKFIPHFIEHCCAVSDESMYITQEMVDSFLATCPSTNGTAKKIQMIRQYTKYLCFLGGKDFVPDDDYSFKQTPYLPFIFTDQELKDLFFELDSFRGHNKGVHLKPELVLPVYSRLLYCCGLRPSEVPSLKVTDFNFETGDLYIRQSKRNKDRHIIMSEDMLNLCRCYNSLAGERTWFFQRKNGEPYRGQWFFDQFEKAFMRAGITRGRPRPYDLRHAFATRNILRWMEAGKDVMAMLPYLAEYMGHTDLSSTLYYIHLLPDNLRKHLGPDLEKLQMIYGEGKNDEEEI